MRRSMTPLRWIAAALLTVTATFLGGGTAAHGIDPYRIVVRVQGRVESQEIGQGASWSPVFRSRFLHDGDLARTLDGSVANVNLADQSTFRIGPNSTVEMTKFQLTPEGRTVVFTLRAGKIQADVAKMLGKQSRFEVKTPNGVLAARGTEFSVTVMKQSELEQLQGQPSKPRAGAGNVDDLLAQGDPDVTLVTVNEGTVDGQMNGHIWHLNMGDNAILGPHGFLFNPPGFPHGQMIPPSQPPPDFNVRHTQFDANGYQDSAHHATMQSQFNHQYDNAYQPYMQQGGQNNQGNSNPIGGGTTNGSPPFFNPSNTVTPLSNTLNGGGTSPNSSPSNGGSTAPTNTGRVIIIIR